MVGWEVLLVVGATEGVALGVVVGKVVGEAAGVVEGAGALVGEALVAELVADVAGSVVEVVVSVEGSGNTAVGLNRATSLLWRASSSGLGAARRRCLADMTRLWNCWLWCPPIVFVKNSSQ